MYRYHENDNLVIPFSQTPWVGHIFKDGDDYMSLVSRTALSPVIDQVLNTCIDPSLGNHYDCRFRLRHG